MICMAMTVDSNPYLVELYQKHNDTRLGQILPSTLAAIPTQLVRSEFVGIEACICRKTLVLPTGSAA